MTVDELTKLDDYGHRRLEDLTEMQLNEYATLLEIRRAEVLRRVPELRKLTMRPMR